MRPPRVRVAHKSHPVARRRALRTIAVFEAAKGIIVLGASLGCLSLLLVDLHHVAVTLIERLRLPVVCYYSGS